jgi:hypothetical protein
MRDRCILDAREPERAVSRAVAFSPADVSLSDWSIGTNTPGMASPFCIVNAVSVWSSAFQT